MTRVVPELEDEALRVEDCLARVAACCASKICLEKEKPDSRERLGLVSVEGGGDLTAFCLSRVSARYLPKSF